MATNITAKVIAFDLDGTISDSKLPISSEMAEVLSQLLQYTKLSIISGSTFGQMKLQVIDEMADDSLFSNFILFPNNGDAMYTWKTSTGDRANSPGMFQKEYEDLLSQHEKKQIVEAFGEIFRKFNLKPETQYGSVLEDRGGQITFSALGQHAPIELRKKWDPDQAIRMQMKAVLDPKLEHFDVQIGGATSIDVTRKGTNKAQAIRKLLGFLGLKTSEALFFGDALFPGGNDSTVKETGVECVQVKDSQDTLSHLRDILSTYEEISGK